MVICILETSKSIGLFCFQSTFNVSNRQCFQSVFPNYILPIMPGDIRYIIYLNKIRVSKNSFFELQGHFFTLCFLGLIERKCISPKHHSIPRTSQHNTAPLTTCTSFTGNVRQCYIVFILKRRLDFELTNQKAFLLSNNSLHRSN